MLPRRIPNVSAANFARYLNGWTDENDWQFLTYLRDNWLVGPSDGPRKISPSASNKDSDYSQAGQSRFIDKVGQQKISIFQKFLHQRIVSNY